MWKIKNPEIRKTILDFTSSGQECLEVSQLIYEHSVIMNAIELMEFDEDAVQLIICSHCGTVQCKSGDWVCFRKSNNIVLLIPCFEKIESDDWSASEFSPSEFYDPNTHNRRKVTPYFDLETYNNLRSSFPNFPRIEEIKQLKISEAMRLTQFNMPFQMFGKPPEVSFRPDKWSLAVGASLGEPKEHLRKIENIIKNNYKKDLPVIIREPLPNEEVIYLFLDASEFIDWKVLVKNHDSYFLMMEENFVIEV